MSLGVGRAPNGNLMPISLCGHELQIASWNGRGIVVHRTQEYFDMGNAIRKLALNRHILCFQEVHGHSSAVRASFNRWLSGWNIVPSVCVDSQGFPDPASGGIVIAICPKLSSFCEIEPQEIVPGRCLSVSLSALVGGLQRNLQILTVHNYGLTFSQVNDIGNMLDLSFETCQAQPYQFFSLLTGDFNFGARDDRNFKIGRPVEHSSLTPACTTGSRQLQWEKHLRRWCEIWQPFPTHYNSVGNSCNRLDRAFSACPKSLLLKLNVSHSVIGSPEAVFSRGESDHAPTALCFGKGNRSVASDPPIPAWITKHLNFKMHLSSLIKYVDIFSLKVADQLDTYNSCIKEAALRVRNEALFCNPDGTEEKKLVLSSVSRALWFNNLGLARKLIAYSASAKELIFIEDSTVKAFSFEAFESIFDDFFSMYHSTQVQNIQQQMGATTSTMLKKKLKSRLQCARRMLSTFWRSGGRLKLAGIKVKDNEGNTTIVTGPKQVQTALSEHWAPVYSKKLFGRGAAELLMADYANRNASLIANFANCQLPKKDRFVAIINRVKDSATGPDGIPYSAYSACSNTSAQILENTAELLGAELEPGFGHAQLSDDPPADHNCASTPDSH